MRIISEIARTFSMVALLLGGCALGRCVGQTPTSTAAQNIVKVCTIYFNQDKKLPARVEDGANSCLHAAKQALAANHDAVLYLVATADKVKDNDTGHGHARTEQDMSGEDLRYADVAAYRAINTKAYMAHWLSVDLKRIAPFTTYEDGQSVELYLVKKGQAFKAAYGKALAPILERPCTVKPCATGPEEFLVAQPRNEIPQP